MIFIDVSGFGHSGKTIVSDYLKMYGSVFSFHNSVEFELFRVSDGLLDLNMSIFESYNLIRSTNQIKKFNNLIKRIGTRPDWKKPKSYFNSSGHCYEDLFKGNFFKESENFINDLIENKCKSIWPYENLISSKLELFFDKLNYKIFNNLVSTQVFYSDRSKFLEYSAKYLNNLFKHVTTANHEYVLMNNALEPWNPSPGLDMCGKAFSIIVNRDPRDIYASMIVTSQHHWPDFEQKNIKQLTELKKNMLKTNDIDFFIYRYKLIQKNIKKANDNRILRINFEDFILNNFKTREKINSHIGLENDLKTLDIESSRKNIGIFESIKESSEIKLIEKELKDYCR